MSTGRGGPSVAAPDMPPRRNGTSAVSVPSALSGAGRGVPRRSSRPAEAFSWRRTAIARHSTRVVPGRRDPAKFTIRSDDIDFAVLATSECADVRLSFLLHPGRTFIRFATDAPPVDPPRDGRALYFRLEDFGFDVDGGNVDILQNM